MSDRVRERGLFAHQDVIRDDVRALKGVAEQVFSLFIAVQLLLRIDVHDVIGEIKITEGNACFQTVDADAAVRPEHVVHMQFAHPFFRFFLEGFRTRREICIFISEQFIGDFSGEKNADIGVLVNVFADQIHSDRSADRGDIIRCEQFDDRFQCADDVVLCDDDVGVVTVNVIGNLARVFQVDGVDVHADRERADRTVQVLCRDAADQGRIKAAGQKKSDRGVRVKPFLNALHELCTDIFRDYIHTVMGIFPDIGQITVTYEFPVFIVVTGREREDFVDQLHEVLRLGSEYDRSLFIITVVQRADPDRVPRRDVGITFCIIEDKSEFRVEPAEHIRTLPLVHRKKNLTVAVALKGIAFFFKQLLDRPEPVNLAVADDGASVLPCERLHS